MRVIGQSTLADGAPYLHLGYVAATTRAPDSTLWTTSIAVLILGAVMVLVRGLASRTTRFRSAEKKLALSVAIVLVFGIGGIVMAFAFARGHTVLANPRLFTKTRAFELIFRTAAQDGTMPAQADDESGETANLDAWSHEMRIDRKVQGGETVYEVISSGPDGVFGTQDDIRLSKSYPLTRPATTRP